METCDTIQTGTPFAEIEWRIIPARRRGVPVPDANAQRDKQLRIQIRTGPKYAPGRVGAMLRKLVHNENGLTKSRPDSILLVDKVGSDPTNSTDTERTRPLLLSYRDRSSRLPVRLARSSKSNSTSSRNQSLQQGVASRTRLPATTEAKVGLHTDPTPRRRV